MSIQTQKTIDVNSINNVDELLSLAAQNTNNPKLLGQLFNRIKELRKEEEKELQEAKLNASLKRNTKTALTLNNLISTQYKLSDNIDLLRLVNMFQLMSRGSGKLLKFSSRLNKTIQKAIEDKEAFIAENYLTAIKLSIETKVKVYKTLAALFPKEVSELDLDDFNTTEFVKALPKLRNESK